MTCMLFHPLEGLLCLFLLKGMAVEGSGNLQVELVEPRKDFDFGDHLFIVYMVLVHFLVELFEPPKDAAFGDRLYGSSTDAVQLDLQTNKELVCCLLYNVVFTIISWYF